MNKELFLIVGASGSGKTYIVNKICKELGMTQVLSKTTRKQRYLGEKGHVFVDNETALKEWSDAVARTLFCGEMYYATREQVEKADFYIIDVKGVKSLKPVDREIKVIFIKANVFLRIWNMLKRGDSIINIIKRIKNDSKEFRGFEELADIVVKNSNGVYDLFIQ